MKVNIKSKKIKQVVSGENIKLIKNQIVSPTSSMHKNQNEQNDMPLKINSSNNYGIFLSYASEDRDRVKAIYDKLQEARLSPWIDVVDLPPGSNWNQEILKVIQNCKIFIACFSKSTVVKNGYIQKELRVALSEFEKKAPESIFFIPALLEEVQIPNISVGTINIQDYQTVPLFNDEHISKLISFLISILK